MYAIVETGGKQYRVQEGQKLRVEKLPVEKGAEVALDKVLLLTTEGGIQVGTPTVAGATVMAEVVDQDRGPRIIVFKKRSKKTYKKWAGHRQDYTELLIKSIGATGAKREAAVAAEGSEPGAPTAQAKPQTKAAKAPAKKTESKAKSSEQE
jgi:large subunit ribosomal protein L21